MLIVNCRRAMTIGGLAVISALATVLVAAADPQLSWSRLKAMPPAERQRLLENLKKFDLLYTPEQQRSLREIDRRINELEPERRDSYLAALRRYHNWLGRLADNKRDELNAKPPAERLELVKRLVKDNPVPRAQTPLFLRITDLGDYSPFELAAFFKIWQVLPPDQQQTIENAPGPNRRGALLSRGESKKMPSEITPPDFAEPHWIRRVETDLRQLRPAVLTMFEKMKKNNDSRVPEIYRRLAANSYFVDNPPKPVSPDRLADFLAAYPGWIQSTFMGYSPDEARRRLTIVYRLVFPYPEEMKPAAKAPVPKPGARANPAPARSERPPQPKATGARGESPF
jgi:hypothetical protein